MSNGDQPIPPPTDINVPPADFAQAGKLHAEGVKDSGYPERIAAAAVAAVAKFLAPLIRILASSMDEILAAVGELFHAGQGEGSHGFALLTAAVLGDLLGVELSGEDLFQAFQSHGRIQAMDVAGSKLVDLLTTEFIGGGELTPESGDAAVRTFLGFVLSFAVRQGNIEFIASLIPEEYRFADGFRMYGELMAKNLGLGRLTRLVFRPLLDILAATPFKWKLNQQYHPQRFSANILGNPFLGLTVDHDMVVKDLDLDGWSAERIAELIKIHQKRLSIEELDLVNRYSTLSADYLAQALRESGYPDELQGAILSIVELKRADAAVSALVAELETRTADGHISLDQLKSYFDALPLSELEKRYRLETAQFKVKAPHKALTLGEVQTAFEQGVLTLDDVEAFLVAQGYSADDVNTLEALTLLKLAKLDEAKKIAQFNYDKKLAGAQAKNRPIPPKPAILV